MKQLQILLEKYEELFDNDKLFDFIDNECKQLFIKSCLNPSFQGWHHDLVLDETGLWLTGAMSCGTMLQSVYNGDAMVLAEMSACVDMSDMTLDWDSDVDSLSDEEKQVLLDELLLDFEIDALKEETEKNGDVFDLTTVFFDKSNYCLFEEKVRKLFPAKWEELEESYVENYWECYGRDVLLEKIYYKIDMERDYLKN